LNGERDPVDRPRAAWVNLQETFDFKTALGDLNPDCLKVVVIWRSCDRRIVSPVKRTSQVKI